VGGEVAGVPLGPRVGAEDHDRFGYWFKKERELRSISLYYVAARTKLAPERVQKIESGSAALSRDGHGRATARLLAKAIGADPDEAVRQLEGRSPLRIHRARPDRSRSYRRGLSATVVLAVALAAYLVANLVLSGDPPSEAPDVVFRPDYVERLVGEESD